MRAYEGLPTEFWQNVKLDLRTRCYVWHGKCKDNGYGIFKGDYAHRVAWEAVAGPIPEGMVINHLCRNRACVRTTHLEVVTQWANLHAKGSRALARQNAAKTHCKRGHPYTEENTRWRFSRGYLERHCRTCLRDYERERYRQRR